MLNLDTIIANSAANHKAVVESSLSRYLRMIKFRVLEELRKLKE